MPKQKSDNFDVKATRIEQGAKSVVNRILQRLKTDAISVAYARESMGILFDIGVGFPRLNTNVPLKEGLIEQLEQYSFKEKHLAVDALRKETTQFLKEISKENSFVRDLFEPQKDESDNTITPILDDDNCWRILTAANRYCGEFTDLFLELKDDIPKRRKDGWMNEAYLDFLEEGVADAATIWQIELIRENFDAIKELRTDVMRYFHEMKSVVNDKFLISIKKEIDKAPSTEKLNQITDNYNNSKAAIAILLKHKNYKKRLLKVETYEDVLKLLTALTAEINKKKKRSPGLIKKLFD